MTALQVGWLGDMLAWRHCAPTAPDTLDTYPYFDTDPFVVR
jgi:DNA polymerase II small subunit/DNA polymerase delta subunit B